MLSRRGKILEVGQMGTRNLQEFERGIIILILKNKRNKKMTKCFSCSNNPLNSFEYFSKNSWLDSKQFENQGSSFFKIILKCFDLEKQRKYRKKNII